MAKHSKIKLSKLENLDTQRKEVAYEYGSDMTDWPKGFLEILSDYSYYKYETERSANAGINEEQLRGAIVEVDGVKTLVRPSFEQIGKIISSKLSERDSHFFKLLLNMVERDTPVEPLRHELTQYKIDIFLRVKAPPQSFDDVRLQLSSKVRESVLDDKTLRKAAKEVGVWPPKVAEALANAPKNEVGK